MAGVSRGVTSHARHSKLLRLPKGIMAAAKHPKTANKRWIRHVNMPIATAGYASANSEPYGFSALMQQRAYMV